VRERGCDRKRWMGGRKGGIKETARLREGRDHVSDTTGPTGGARCYQA